MIVSPPIHNEYHQSVLIVDDDEMILEILSAGFKMNGLKVFKAENGLDGWKIFKKKKIDIVLTDIEMPILDGIELSKRIRNQSPHTRIALMTGSSADIFTELLNDGTAEYLFMKPFALSFVCKSLIAEAKIENNKTRELSHIPAFEKHNYSRMNYFK